MSGVGIKIKINVSQEVMTGTNLVYKDVSYSPWCSDAMLDYNNNNKAG